MFSVAPGFSLERKRPWPPARRPTARRGGFESLLHNRRAGLKGCAPAKAGLSPYPALAGFGDFPLGFHPHLHILVSDPPEADFHENDMFSVSQTVDTKTLEQIFRHKVLPARRGTS